MGKKIKGVLKGCAVPSTSKTGYKDTWDMGNAANAKKNWRLLRPDRPSV